MEATPTSSEGALLSLFSRVPQPGKAKTRLITLLGDEGAARLQRKLTEHVARMMRHAQAVCSLSEFMGEEPLEVECEARIVDGTTSEASAWLGLEARPQSEGDLGARMASAILDGFAHGYEVVAVLGGDCPELTGARIAEALREAKRRGAALIPAFDGGYCLFALRSDAQPVVEELFANIAWSTPEVCAQQCERLAQHAIEVALLERLSDVDGPQDLELWDAIDQLWYQPPQSASVIIPTLNEANNIASCIESARSYLSRCASHLETEFLVADGGSGDRTVDIARSRGARVITGANGRAEQMNAAAREARGDMLMFIHADTKFAQSSSCELMRPFEDPDFAVGAYAFGFDTSALSYPQRLACMLYAFNTRARVRLKNDPYGDQALFCRRALFESLGGYGTVPFMEDALFVERAREVGQVVMIADSALTSPRRYIEHGFIKTMLVNRWAAQQHAKGVALDDIHEWYRTAFTPKQQGHLRKIDN